MSFPSPTTSQIKASTGIVGKNEPTWANFSVMMQGKDGKAQVTCQAYKRDNNWVFTQVTLEDFDGKKTHLTG